MYRTVRLPQQQVPRQRKKTAREIGMAEVVPAHEQLAAHTRLALRRLASAVAVVTCRDGQTRHAMTATAVNAMSMQPPSMIVCVNRSSAFMRRSAAPTVSRSTSCTAARRTFQPVAAARLAAKIVSISADGAKNMVCRFSMMRKRISSAPRKTGSTTAPTQFFSAG
jgi:hypothetical protein